MMTLTVVQPMASAYRCIAARWFTASGESALETYMATQRAGGAFGRSVGSITGRNLSNPICEMSWRHSVAFIALASPARSARPSGIDGPCAQRADQGIG